jgi:hypothetical protein
MKIRAGDYRLLSCETFGALVAGFAIVGLRDHCRATARHRLLLFLEGGLGRVEFMTYLACGRSLHACAWVKVAASTVHNRGAL